MTYRGGEVGKAVCVECEGEGVTRSMLCRECEGTGWIKCEHWEYDDHNLCLECGYFRSPDLVVNAERRILP